MLPVDETGLVDEKLDKWTRMRAGLTLELLHHIVQLPPHQLVLVRLCLQLYDRLLRAIKLQAQVRVTRET